MRQKNKLSEVSEVQRLRKAHEDIIFWIEEAVKDKMTPKELAILITCVRSISRNALKDGKKSD